MYPKCKVTQCEDDFNTLLYVFLLDKDLINCQVKFEWKTFVRKPPDKNLIEEYFFIVLTTSKRLPW